MAEIAYLESVKSGNRVSADVPRTLDPATAESLYVRYDMDALRKTARRENPAKYAAESAASLGMWRYKDVLPSVEPVTLGEGWTPMVRANKRAGRDGGLLIKCEGDNPTGSFKARGLAMAVTMARHYGLRHLAVPSAGNAAGALAAYCAAAGMKAHLYMPQDVPFANYLEGVVYGADVHMVDGFISDCARMVGEEIKRQKAEGVAAEDVWFDISTLKGPFRVEGKKTMGYELCEQLGWEYPDAVFYPTGGGVGLIGMWKAFEEMEQLGWISGKRPRMYALQASGCAPVVKAYDAGEDVSQFFEGARTFAAGLRVPKPYGDALILDIVRESGGKALTSTDEEILASILDYAKEEGLFLSPEGAAATAAYERLVSEGELKSSDRVVLIDTGAGLKYADVVAEAMKLRRPGGLPVSMPVGGIITPV